MQLLITGKTISLQDGCIVSTGRIPVVTTDHRYTIVHFCGGKRSELHLKSLISR